MGLCYGQQYYLYSTVTVLTPSVLHLLSSKLVSLEVPGLIDTRVVNFNPTCKKDITSNLNLLLNAAAVLGCDVSGINAADFIENKVIYR